MTNLASENEFLLPGAQAGIDQQPWRIPSFRYQHRTELVELRVPAQFLFVEPVIETLFDIGPKLCKARRWIGLDFCSVGKIIDSTFDIWKIVFVKLLIRSKRRAVKVLDADIVALGYSNQSVYQRTCFQRLASHQLDHLSRRNTEQVKRKAMQYRRFEKIGKGTKLFVQPDRYKIVVIAAERLGHTRNLLRFRIFFSVFDFSQVRSRQLYTSAQIRQRKTGLFAKLAEFHSKNNFMIEAHRAP